MYFLTVHDIVRFARSQGILCQGRGSAANSVVCYVLGITAVAPEDSHLLFERFISKERSEPPDIDVDFEHDRREEVIQYIYAKYGRERAAITAVVTTYRTRSALRDVGKALGVAPALVDAFAKDHHWFDEGMAADQLQSWRKAWACRCTGTPPRCGWSWPRELKGFPRHLSQHVGGFVLTQGKLTRLVPVEPAAWRTAPSSSGTRTTWTAMGLLKVDVLALGMLSACAAACTCACALRGEPWGCRHPAAKIRPPTT
jgi:error-prone DNA polymerase